MKSDHEILIVDKGDTPNRLKKLCTYLNIQGDQCLQDKPTDFNCNDAELVIIHTELIDDWCKKAAECQNVVFLFVSNNPQELISAMDDRCKLKNCHSCEYPASKLHEHQDFIKFIKQYKKECWDLLKYPSPEHLIALYLLDIPFTNPPAKGFKKDFEKSAKQIWDSIHGNAVKEFGHCKNKFGNEISCTGLPDSWEDHEGRRKCIAEILSKL